MTFLILYLCWMAIGAIVTMLLSVSRYFGKRYVRFAFGTYPEVLPSYSFVILRALRGAAAIAFFPVTIVLFRINEMNSK